MEQAEVCRFLREHYADRLSAHGLSIMEKVFAHPGIRRRHFAVDAPASVVGEDPDARVRRFLAASVDLAADAAAEAMRRAGIAAHDLAALIVNTCTGYVCPGISTYLGERLGLARTIPTYDLVGAGCGGAFPNLTVGCAMLRGSADGVVLCVSVEITTATFEMGDDLSLIVSNALFADGAGACVLWRRPAGLRLVETADLLAPEHREAIRYVHRHGRLHNQLSPRLPAILGELVPDVVTRLAASHGVAARDVRHWAIHPGGTKVIDAIQRGVGLTDEQVRITREVLEAYGNMSSATVWFVLERIMRDGPKPGDWCCMLGAGAGLSVHGALLRAE